MMNPLEEENIASTNAESQLTSDLSGLHFRCKWVLEHLENGGHIILLDLSDRALL